VTSQACGACLRYVLSKGLPLLSSNPEETWPATAPGLVAEPAAEPANPLPEELAA